jgi:hypothetical protein
MKRSQNLLSVCVVVLATSLLIAVAAQGATVNYQFSGLMNDPLGRTRLARPSADRSATSHLRRTSAPPPWAII